MQHAGQTDRLYLGEEGGEGKGREGEGAYRCFYACHYADCEHEVELVKSGYRLVLVCFLFLKENLFISYLFFSPTNSDLLPLLLCFPTPSLYSLPLWLQ